jgi:hypothetical protein
MNLKFNYKSKLYPSVPKYSWMSIFFPTLSPQRVVFSCLVRWCLQRAHTSTPHTVRRRGNRYIHVRRPGPHVPGASAERTAPVRRRGEPFQDKHIRLLPIGDGRPPSEIRPPDPRSGEFSLPRLLLSNSCASPRAILARSVRPGPWLAASGSSVQPLRVPTPLGPVGAVSPFQLPHRQ